MQNVYSKISPSSGPHIAGICKIKIAPIEWLDGIFSIDFATGKVIDNIYLNNDFIEIELLQDTYDYTEKPKSTKPGSFYEISISGNTNTLDAATLQILNTYRYHQFIALVLDRQGRQKIVGNFDAGLVLQFQNKETTDKGGTQLISIDMAMDSEYPSPFYELPITRLATPYLFASVISEEEISLAWDAVPDATGYVLEIATDMAFTTDVQTFAATSPHNITGLIPDTLYYIRVKATDTVLRDSVYQVVSATTGVGAVIPIPTANLWAWYKADTGVTGTTDVTQWNDQSVNGRNLLPFLSPATTYTPELATGVINGLPVIRTKATGSGASMSTAATLPDNLTTGMTIYIVASQKTTGAISDTDGSFLGSGSAVQLKRSAALNKISGRLRSSTVIAPADILVNDTFYTYRMGYDTINQLIAINNALISLTSITDTGSFSADTLSIFNHPGYGSSGNKQIAEIIVYTEFHDSTKISQVENYLRTKYAHY